MLRKLASRLMCWSGIHLWWLVGAKGGVYYICSECGKKMRVA